MDNNPPEAVQAAAAAPAVATRPVPPDPMVELERLRELNRRWRRTALAGVAAFLFLFVISCVQFLATMSACKLLRSTREDMKLADLELRQLSESAAERTRELRDADEQFQAARADALAAKETIRALLAVLMQHPGADEDEEIKRKRQELIEMLKETLVAQDRDPKRAPGFVRPVSAMEK